MPNFNFSVLNDKELEELARDLLNRKFNLDFQTFKRGKDGGIDLRLSSSTKTNHKIVQVKHYLKAGLAALLRDLKKNEAQKVKLLSPNEYWLVTSLELSPSDKDKIKALFSPFIVSTNHVFGQEDLNKYLNEFPDILKTWFKLWLTSSAMLHIIFNNAIEGRSRFYSEKILSKIRLYVSTEVYNDAAKILRKNHYVLISGQPGVGKTTLADTLSYNLMAKGFRLYYIEKDIREAESVFEPSVDVKQLFFFDDFLGSNYVEILNPKSTESGIVNFLERVRSSKNKYLILTTRTTILNTALSNFEKLKRSRIDFARKEIVLGDYTEYDKALILYNHLFHSGINTEFVKEIFKDRNYWKIIKHKNYNPRLIEFFTNPYNLEKLLPKQYFEFVITNLGNPHEIWSHSFKDQLIDEDRLLIFSLFTLGGYALYTELELAYSDRVEFERRKFNFKPQMDSFRSATKRLLDGYVIIKRDEKKAYIEFVNPSINDFLIGFLVTSTEERHKLVDASFFIEQLDLIYSAFYKDRASWKVMDDTNYIIEHVQKNIAEMKSLKGIERLELKIASLLSRLRSAKSGSSFVEQYIGNIFDKLNFECEGYQELNHMITILRNIHNIASLQKSIRHNWNKIIKNLFGASSDDDDFDKILELFEIYEMSYSEYLSDFDNRLVVQLAVAEFVDDQTPGFIEHRLESVYTESEFSVVKWNVANDRAEIFEKYELEDENYSEGYFFDNIKIDDVIIENYQRISFERNVKKIDNVKVKKVYSPERQIDDLFS